MTIHVLHAGDGYLYLMRSVAAQDGQRLPGQSLATYYTAKGQPPGRWMGSGASRLAVSGFVTEEQMKSLFGQGMHPNAALIREEQLKQGSAEQDIAKLTRLGRRFPRYDDLAALGPALRRGYRASEKQLGRRLTDGERLAVRQEVAVAQFEARSGRAPLDPIELQGLGERATRREAVAGYDLVFTPVKSVSVLWGIGSDETRRAIYEAHRAAVDDAVQWLEQNAAFTRTGDAGQAQIDTLGVTAAAFDHWDSRVGDPDLHTHVAISNKVQGSDARWRSLDGRALFASAVSLSERYNSRIEDQLRERLGVRFVERATSTDRRPVREIDGVPSALLDGFAKRRQGIERQYQELLDGYRRSHGHEPAPPARHHLYQRATLTKRPDKSAPRSLQQMVGEWRAEADAILGVPGAGEAVERRCLHQSSASSAAEVDQLADQVLAVLTESRSTWNVHHVRAEAHRQARPHTTNDRSSLVEAVVAAATDPRHSIRLAVGSTTREPAELRRADGESVFTEHAAVRFTNAVILDAEQRIVTAARQHTTQRLTGTALKQATCSAGVERPLNPGQQSLVRAFCGSGRVVQLGLAPAGAGKTTAMREVARGWTASGRAVVALAPSAVAASLLGAELGVRAETLAKFDVDEPDVREGTMILVDEAGTAGTLMLDRLVQRAQACGAVVRLLGDDQQLGAVEAGGVLRQVAHEVGAVRMDEVVRFDDPAEAAATIRVRAGDPDAVEFYLERGRVIAGTTITAPDAAYAGWLADQETGRDSLLLASSSADVSALNARARADLVLAGRVGPDGVTLRDGNVAGVGDRVTTRHNDRLLAVHAGRDWVKNGDTWTVVTVQNGTLGLVHRGHGGQVTLPPDYVQRHVELDYARTIRRSQGMTVDRAHLLVEPHLAREDLYVGLSRARLGTNVYVATIADLGPDHLPDAAGGTADVLRSIVRRSGVETSAFDTLRLVLAEAESLRRMSSEYEYALGVAVGDRYRVAVEAAHPGLPADHAWSSVVRRLHRLEAGGCPVETAIRRADAMRSYSDALSEAQVLSFRLDRLIQAAGLKEAPVPAWLATPPPEQVRERWRTYLSERYDDMARRLSELVATQSHDPWTRDVGHGSARVEALRQVVAYRSVYEVSTGDPLGREPDRRTRQHEAWADANAALRRSREPDPAGSGARHLMRELQDRPAAETECLSAVNEHAGPSRHR